MSDDTLLRQIEGARAYEALFVPALLGQYAQQLLEEMEAQRQ